MEKIFSTSFKTGSLVNTVSGKLGTPTDISIVRTEKGNACLCNGSSSKIVLNETIVLGTVFSFECYVRIIDNNFSYIALGGQEDTGSYPLTIRSDLKSIYLNDGSSYVNEERTSLFDHNWHHLISIRNGASVIFYVDNVPGVTQTLSTNVSQNITRLFSRISDGMVFKGFVGDINIYDYVLTEKERVLAYRDFLNSYPLFPEKHPQQSLVSKPMDLSMEKDNTLTETTRNWVVNSGNPIINGDTITFHNTEGVYSTGTFAVGKRYRIRYIITNYSGSPYFLDPYNGFVGNNYITSNGSYDCIYDSDTVNCYMYSTGTVTCTIQILSIAEVTGLIAAYNFVPNGNILTDISGNGRNGTLVGNPMMIKNGIKAQTNQYVNLGATTAFNSLTNLTVLGRVKINSDSMPYITGFFNQFTGIMASLSLYVYYGTTLYVDIRNDNSGNATVSSSVLPLNEYFDYAVVFNGNGETNYDKLKLYINSVLIPLTYDPLITSITAPDLNTVHFYVGSLGPVYTEYASKDLIDFRAYNRSLSLQEIKDYHNSFVKPSFIEDFSSEGADGIAKVPTGWFNYNGDYKIGEISGLGKNIVPAASAYFDTDGTSYYDTARGSVSWNSVNKNMIYTSTDNGGENRAYRAGVFTLNKYYRIELDAKSDTPANTSIIPWFEDSFETIEYHSLTSSFQHYVTQGRATTFDYLYLVFGSLMPTGNTVVSDNIIITQITKLNAIKNGTKYAECINGESSLVVPNNQVYGTWEFDFYKATDARFEFVLMCDDYKLVLSSTPNYRVQVYEDTHALRLLSEGGLLIETAANYIKDNTWYGIKVTRSITGLFTLYIKGGQYGDNDWTRVSASGYGTNPVTDTTYLDSKYSFFNNVNTSGNRITNIKFLDGIRYQIKYGPEICINGGFDSDTVWGKSAGVTISDGKLSSDGTITDDPIASHSVNYSFGGNRKFLYSFTVSGYVQGAVVLLLGEWLTPGDSVMGSNGRHEFEGYPNSGSGSGLYIWSSGTFIGSIDDISIKEVFD